MPSVGGPGSLSEQVSGATVLPVSRATVAQHRGFVISAGTKIPCLPVEAADSGLGGFYTCRVPEAVRDDTQSYRLLAPGTLVLGQVKKGLDHGQERLGILFTMIRTPDDLRIPLAAPAADAMGRSGLNGNVETFFWEKVGATATYALIDGVQNAITGGIQAGIARFLDMAAMTLPISASTAAGSLSPRSLCKTRSTSRLSCAATRLCRWKSVWGRILTCSTGAWR